MFDSTTRACAFAAAVATTIVGVVHAVNSFRGAGLGLRWSNDHWFDTCNESVRAEFMRRAAPRASLLQLVVAMAGGSARGCSLTPWTFIVRPRRASRVP